MKVVINACFGGFCLSEAGVRRYLELAGRPVWVEARERFQPIMGPEYWLVPPGPERLTRDVASAQWDAMSLDERQAWQRRWAAQRFSDSHLDRTDPLLVRVVEELGDAANGRYAKLRVVEIPDGTQWQIEEYDGNEHVAEKHETWR